MVVIRFAFFAASGPSRTAQRIAEVSATLALRYAIERKALSALDDNAVQDFAETNGVYNAWPYWREILQATAARVGLPGIVAPLFRIIPEVKNGKAGLPKRAGD